MITRDQIIGALLMANADTREQVIATRDYLLKTNVAPMSGVLGYGLIVIGIPGILLLGLGFLVIALGVWILRSAKANRTIITATVDAYCEEKGITL